jgi:hypothetical protein
MRKTSLAGTQLRRHGLIQQLEPRILLAAVVSQSWEIDTAPQRLVIEFDVDMRTNLQASDADIDNVTTDTQVTGTALQFSPDGKTATFSWPEGGGAGVSGYENPFAVPGCLPTATIGWRWGEQT